MNRFESAGKTWPILTAMAQARSPILYMDLASKLGYKGARPTRFPLWTIQDFCIERNLPPITILVINEKTGLPGPGFIAWPRDQLDEGRERVYSFDWSAIAPPFTKKSVRSIPLASNTDIDFSVDDRDVAVNGRGPYQDIFRKKLLDAYGGACALCDTRLDTMLVASHIVPWSIDRRNRLNPQNGLLLCRTHDVFFEKGWIKIEDDLTTQVELSDEFGPDLFRFAQRTKKKLRACKRCAIPNRHFLDWHRQNSRRKQK